MRNIHAALQELKTNYVSGLPLKVEAIESQWHRFQQDNLVDSLKELYILAHSLTGSGATFGFSALTDTAKTIERLIKPYLDGDNAISPQDKMVIHTKINHFKVLLKRINESTNHIETISTVKGVSLKASDSFHSVLLADDDDDTRSLISTQLKSFGFSVIEARNGAEAIECYKAHKPHIILMDVIMPEINGYDAVKEIRNQSRLTYLPIIFLTANDDESEVVRCIESGGDDFVVKSLNNFPVIAKIMAF
ncbi:MAG: response regulator, partial [Gammaproteobacteria bacterium]|nr:response regulator [Gammaproteobacteria bacterium]